MPKTIFLHIGYPKTGTKTLQVNLFRQLAEKGHVNLLSKPNESDSSKNLYSYTDTLNYILGFSAKQLVEMT